MATHRRACANIRPRRARGRGLKMSSRCVIAYIDPIPLGVYIRSAHRHAAPTRETHGARVSHAYVCTYVGAMRPQTRSRTVHIAAPAARALCVRDVYRVARKRWGSILLSDVILMTFMLNVKFLLSCERISNLWFLVHTLFVSFFF